MSAAKVWWQQYGLTAMLGATALGAVAVVGLETDWGKQLRATGTPERPAAGGTELAPALPAFKLGDADTVFRESGERPLFTPTRRPPLPVQAAAVQQMKRGQFKLAGTVVNADTSVAYLVEIAGNKTLRVNKGAEVLGQAGLVVDSVEPSRVVLKMGDETEILELRTAASPPKPPVPLGAVPGQVPPGAPVTATVAPGTGLPANVAGINQPPAAVPVQGQAPAPRPQVPISILGGIPRTGAGDGGVQASLEDLNAAAQRRRRFQAQGQGQAQQQPQPQQ